MKLHTIMKRAPQTVSATETIHKAREMMLWGGFRHLPVTGKDNKLLGILTEHDIACYQANRSGSSRVPLSDTVSMAMKKLLHTAGPNDSLTEAAARMASESISCLPITEKGVLIGLITTTDVLAAAANLSLQEKAPIGPTVSDIMSRDPHCAHPGDPLLDAAAKMSQYGIRHVPVVDGDRRIVGILSDRDILGSIGNSLLSFQREVSEQIKELRVRDAMSTAVITVEAHQSSHSVARRFISHKLGALPVVDDNDVVVGIVSYLDILKTYIE